VVLRNIPSSFTFHRNRLLSVQITPIPLATLPSSCAVSQETSTLVVLILVICLRPTLFKS
jgi:hypothetical protein